MAPKTFLDVTCLACGAPAVVEMTHRINAKVHFGLCRHHYEVAIVWAGATMWARDLPEGDAVVAAIERARD